MVMTTERLAESIIFKIVTKFSSNLTLANYKPKKYYKEETMRRKTLIILIVALFIVPSISWAQKEGKMMQGSAMTQGNTMMQGNMMMMSDMMMKMSELLSKGNMKPEHQKQCGDMLKQMSQTIRNMAPQHEAKVDEQAKKELKKVSKDLEPLYEYMMSH
ncbi:MAG TPA: hypothetical protein VE912_05080 [Bacteroidales bacterium]|nr:hypothetical protein [Bacteroidales bacterium]